MMHPPTDGYITLPPEQQPLLLVIVDAEEEFVWGQYSPGETGVRAMRYQHRAQSIMDRYEVVPTYVIDYPVADQREGYAPLLDYLRDGRCEIGAQLHPWVNPPIAEEISERNSFPGNLPRALEADKLRRLTDRIAENLQMVPRMYKAGRYGIGANTLDILLDHGYGIDLSVRPHFDLSKRGGPNYCEDIALPYWIGPDRQLLEIPSTIGMLGPLANRVRMADAILASRRCQRLRLTGLLARIGLLDRIGLSPEGTRIDEAKLLTRHLLERGYRVFTMSYHSPSVEPGNTPYVRTQDDLDLFLQWIDEYLDFFRSEIGGEFSTPFRVRARLEQLSA